MAQIAYCRDFSSSSYISINGGSLGSSVINLHTMAVLVKLDSLGSTYQGIFYGVGPLGDTLTGISTDNGDDYFVDAADGVGDGVGMLFESSSITNTGQWNLVVLRKHISGTAQNAMTMSIYNYTLATWLHVTPAYQTRQSPINLNNFELGHWEFADYLDGKIACAAYATGNLFASNAAIESSGIKDNLQSWVDAGFQEGWLLDQPDELLGITTFVGTSALTTDNGTLALSISDLPFDVALAATTPQTLRPDGDLATTGWSTAPLWSKIEEESADGTVITGVAS